MVVMQNSGVHVDVPPGWDARLSRRDPADPSIASAAALRPALLHAASFALPAEVGDFGSGAVEVMRVGDAFVTLFEHDPSSAGTPLFASVGLPGRLLATDFGEDALQRPQAGQVGLQRFFTLADRAFCLYVVLGHRALGLRRLPIVNDMIASIRVD